MFRMHEITNATQKGVSIPPPRLHWGWVLALNLITALLFYGVWLMVQSNWSRRARGRSVAFPISIVLFAAQLGLLFLNPSNGGMIVVLGFVISTKASDLVALFWLIAVLLQISNLFILRRELMNKPISIHLSGLATLFFGPVYFQYHLRNYQGIPVTHIHSGLGLS